MERGELLLNILQFYYQNPASTIKNSSVQFTFPEFYDEDIRILKIHIQNTKDRNKVFGGEVFLFAIDDTVLDRIHQLKFSSSDTYIYIKYCLFSFCTFLHDFEQSKSVEYGGVLLDAISSIITCQINNDILLTMLASAFVHTMEITLEKCKCVFFQERVETITTFYMKTRFLNQPFYFTVLPILLEKIVSEVGFGVDSFTSSFVALFIQIYRLNENYFEASGIAHIFNCVINNINKLDEEPFLLLSVISSKLSIDKFLLTLEKLPIALDNLIREKEPFYTIPPKIDVKEIRLPGHDFVTTWNDKKTFPNGIDLNPPVMEDPLPLTETSIVDPRIAKQVETIVVMIKNNAGTSSDLIYSFFQSLVRFFQSPNNDEDVNRIDSSYRFDYLSLFVSFWFQFANGKTTNPSLQMDKNLIPISVFDPHYEETKEIRNIKQLAMHAVFLSNIEIFVHLVEMVSMYPDVLTKIFDFCSYHADEFRKLVLTSQGADRYVPTILGQLMVKLHNYELYSDNQNSDFIETTRSSLFRLINILFENKDILRRFFMDTAFPVLFSWLIFEESVRSFVLHHFQEAFTLFFPSLSDKTLPNVRNTILQYASVGLPSDRMVNTLIDVFKLFNSILKPDSIMLDKIPDYLIEIFTNIQENERSTELINELIKFLMYVPEPSLPLYIAIESALCKLAVVDITLVNHLICLISGQIEPQPIDRPFIIKKGRYLNLLFTVCINRDLIDVIKFTSNLITYSYKNAESCNHTDFDNMLLDYIYEHQQEDTSRIMDLFIEIASRISSPKIVQKYLSLFFPIGQKYSAYTKQFIRPLKILFSNMKQKPVYFQRLNQRYDYETFINMNEPFSFKCWLYYDTNSITELLTIAKDRKELVRISIKKGMIFVNKKSTTITIPEGIWSLITFNFICPKKNLIIFINQDEVLPINLNIKDENMLTFTNYQISIGEALSSINESSESAIGSYCLEQEEVTKDSIINTTLNGPQGKWIKLDNDKTNMLLEPSFASILLSVFKLSILLPLYAQLDMKHKDGTPNDMTVIDITSIFAIVLQINIDLQDEFQRMNGYKIIAHILMSVNPRHITADLFLQFGDMYIKLKDRREKKEDLIKDLKNYILTNFDIWIVSEPKQQYQIISRMQEMSMNNGLEFKKFLAKLKIINIYYSTIMNEEWNTSKRSRPADLDLHKCREIIMGIRAIDETPGNNYNLETIIDYCIAIYTTDVETCIDMLKYIETHMSALHPTPQKLKFLNRLMATANDKLVLAIFTTIVSLIHNDETSFDHLGISLLYFFSMPNITQYLLHGCMDLMNARSPKLFEICTYLSMKANDITLYKYEPSPKYINHSPTWCMWSISHALNSRDDHASLIYDFLIQCCNYQYNVLLDIFCSLKLCCQLHQLEFKENYSLFLTRLAKHIVNPESKYLDKTISDLFRMYVYALFFRDFKPLSDILHDFFMDSPFRDQVENYPKTKPTRHEMLSLDKIPIIPDLCVFGFRVSKELNWLDEDLALTFLKLLRKHAGPAGNRNYYDLQLALILASFLIQQRPEEVKKWKAKMNLTEYERLELKDYIKFLNYKLDRSHVTDTVQDFENRFELYQDQEIMSKMMIKKVAVKDAYIDWHKKAFQDGYEQFEKIVENMQDILLKQYNDIKDTIHGMAKEWTRFWQNVAMNGNPWDYGQTTIIRWKRDPMLCGLLPFKLRKNKNFDNHKLASLTRDSGCHDSAAKIRKAIEDQEQEAFKKQDYPELLTITSFVKLDENEVHSQIPISSINCHLVKINKVHQANFYIDYSRNEVSLGIKKGDVIRKFKKIPIKSISEVQPRTWLHRCEALEIFCNDGSTYFIRFFDKSVRKTQLKQLEKICGKRITKNLQTNFEQMQITQKWIDCEISNFEYLLLLNKYSGRSFNTCSAYPFVPWVLADYSSEKLDLTSPESFRDLSKPVGALGEERLEELKQRRMDMSNFDSDPYLFSSFSICPLTLYIWLLRLEPFTTLHIQMQSNRFDHPCRLFNSIPESYFLAVKSLNNYRELTPEFYFQPEFLLNMNEFDLGYARKEQVNDVKLPPWAENVFDFVYKNRKAMESDYVSSQINNYIDLVWGYKQKGREADKADNTYPPDLYEDVWKRNESRMTKVRKSEIEANLSHVGQIPAQLFNSEHPIRNLSAKYKSPVKPGVMTYPSANKIVASHCCKNQIIYATSDQIICITNPLREDKTSTPQKKAGIKYISGSQTFLLNNGETEGFKKKYSNVTCIQSDEDCSIIIEKNSTIQFETPNLCSFINLYSGLITCCCISKKFGVAVIGTKNHSLVICSLFEGKIANIIHLDNITPIKVMTTRQWGFIVMYGSIWPNEHKQIIVWNMNGMKVATVTKNLPHIKCWCTWESFDGFDYIAYIAENRKLYYFEVYYPNIIQNIESPLLNDAIEISFDRNSCMFTVVTAKSIYFVPMTNKKNI